jgi:hypothetical protein
MPKLKDIFVDTNLAKNFCNPVDPDLKEFIRWLFYQGSLVITTRILREYCDTCQGAASQSSILVIVAHQTKKRRLAKITNPELAAVVFTNAEIRVITCNPKDHDHLKAVHLSRRKLALTRDKKFADDVVSLPRIRGTAAGRPQDLPYRGSKKKKTVVKK